MEHKDVSLSCLSPSYLQSFPESEVLSVIAHECISDA